MFFKYLPAILLSSFIIKLLITGTTLGDGVAIIALVFLYIGNIYLESKKEKPANSELLDRVIYLEEQLGDTKQKISAISLQTAYRK